MKIYHVKFVLIKYLVMVLFLNGCASGFEARMVESDLPLDIYHVNYSTTNKKGSLLLKLRPPSVYQQIYQYRVRIDDHSPFLNPRKTNIHIELDKGVHSLRIVALTDKMPKLFKGIFGKEMIHEFEIKENQELVIKYIGAYTMFSAGKIKDEGYNIK